MSRSIWSMPVSIIISVVLYVVFTFTVLNRSHLRTSIPTMYFHVSENENAEEIHLEITDQDEHGILRILTTPELAEKIRAHGIRAHGKLHMLHNALLQSMLHVHVKCLSPKKVIKQI